MRLWFGVAGYMIPFCVMLIGISSSFWSTSKIYPRLLWFLLATFCLSGLADMSTQFWYSFVDKFEIGSPGGLIGDMLANRTLGYLIGKTGTAIIFFVLFVISTTSTASSFFVICILSISQQVFDICTLTIIVNLTTGG